MSYASTSRVRERLASSMECYACTQQEAPRFHSRACGRARRPVLDPRSRPVQCLNRWLLLARAIALAADPLFFYSLSIVIGSGGLPTCLRLDSGSLVVVTALRTAVDAAHMAHVWVQMRLAYVSRESLVIGCGKLVWDPRMVADHYLRSSKGFWFDLFVIVPFPQTVFWVVAPTLIREEKINLLMTVLLIMFLFQFLPKVHHIICVMRRMQKVTGFIFGSIWWGFGLNLIAYFIASHVAGGCWYVLTIQRIAPCLQQQQLLQCEKNESSNLHFTFASTSSFSCLKDNGPFPYGIYSTALPVVSSSSLAVKTLYPIFWGLMTLSTFGNTLEPTSHWLEVIFSIVMVLSGLMLFTLLIGNIQVFLHSVMARKRKMQLRCRDMEWWMRRRQLPAQLRKRVRRYDQQRWGDTRGEDETELVKDLPNGLRRDIKRHLCLDLIQQVPMFHNLDDLILDNICDRVEPLFFSKNEKVIREGDPVQRIIFIVKGTIQSSQQLSRGMVATCILSSGGFFGDELLSWCLRHPFLDRLPASSATFTCIEPTKAFGFDAPHLRYIIDHFRYKFSTEKFKRIARFYSTNWRTWAAVNIQMAWRRYKGAKCSASSTAEMSKDDGDERRLQRCAAVFMSLRPHDHLQ